MGGRLHNAQIAFEYKHSGLLPQRRRLSKLIVFDIYNRSMHPGINRYHLILARAAILGDRCLIRKCIGRCCFWANPCSCQPAMPPLPSSRVSRAKPLSHVGVDYGGSFTILLSRRSSAVTQKAYLCLFVCFPRKQSRGNSVRSFH